ASGEARLSDAVLSLSGAARDAVGADALQAALGQLPAGLSLGDARIERPQPMVVAAPAPAAGETAPELQPSPAPGELAPAAEAAAGPEPAAPLNADACQAGFKQALESARIEFDTDLATISP